MKKFHLILTLLAAAILTLPSCSSNDTADAEDLLATVPSDASLVIVANTHKILEKAGCDVSGSTIVPGPEVQNLLAKNNNGFIDPQVMALFNGDSGIDPSVITVFQVGYYTYATGFLADPAKFKEMVQKQFNSTFSTENGIDVCAAVAVSNSQFWLNIGQGSIDPKEVKHFTALDKAQSFLSNRFADKLCKITRDIEGWGNINGLLNTTNMGFQQRATFQIAIQTIFEDPANISFSLNFDKGECKTEAKVLNSKGNVAKLQFPTKELDLKTIASVGGTADGIIAISIPNKMIEKLTKEADSKSPSVFGLYLKALQGLDGTAAFAYSNGPNMRGIISTNGNDLAPLTNLLGEAGLTVNIDGKILRVNQGDAKGKGSVEVMSSEFKGAFAGVVVSDFGPHNISLTDHLKNASFLLCPEGDGMYLKVTLKSQNDKENILLTIIKNQ